MLTTRSRLWSRFLPICLSLATAAAAEVVRIDVISREPFGQPETSAVGPYERIRGRVVYSLDPAVEANRAIVDLELAVTDERGHVQFFGDIEIIAPVDLQQAERLRNTSVVHQAVD